ncbi:MAG: response regulator [Burkholderiales bacterium]|nr:response regulator [Burkholderiales bacterium]
MTLHDACAPLRILMLEDSVFDAELIQAALARTCPHAQVRLVSDERSFAQALASGAFDLVLSDVELPGYGGEHALDHCKAVAPELPFIFVSGVIGEENAVDLLKRGATDYVSKDRLGRLPLVIERAQRERAERAARMRAERQLREADSIYARVVDGLSGHGVILLGTDGIIRDWNQAASVIFGYARAEMIGRNISTIHTPEDRAADVVRSDFKAAATHGSVVVARWLVRADGSRLRAEGAVTVLRDEDGEVSGFCQLLRDVTSTFESAAALLQAKEEAERANRAKDRFLAVLSHELRTPLLPIAAAAQTLQKNVVVPPELAELLPMIRRNVLLEARLIEDLLDLTAISAGKLSLRRAPVDMRKIIDIVVEMVQETVDEKQIDLTVHWSAGRGVVDGDAARLQQVLWNLVRNAVKFTPAGGRIRIEVENEGPRLRLCCIDDGIGIEASALPLIFSAFEQASDDISRQFGGLGLGLAIAQGLVLEHGGELSVNSDGLGRGATFTLRLDTVDAPDAVAAQPAVAAPDSVTARPVRMLLVEDNEDAACAMTMSLEFMGYQVTHAANLRAAMTAGERDAFDVIVTDLGLPDGSGLDLGPALSARAPLIALSGFGSAEDVARSMAAGFAAHLVKPTDPDDVHAMVGKILMRTAAAPASAGAAQG